MIDLGKYGVTVLSAYGITLSLLAGLVWHSLSRNARIRRALEEEERHG